jgi:hypothetical protein
LAGLAREKVFGHFGHPKKGKAADDGGNRVEKIAVQAHTEPLNS